MRFGPRGGSRRYGNYGGFHDEHAPVVPPERRGRTVRRIVAFFRPYRLQVASS